MHLGTAVTLEIGFFGEYMAVVVLLVLIDPELTKAVWRRLAPQQLEIPHGRQPRRERLVASFLIVHLVLIGMAKGWTYGKLPPVRKLTGIARIYARLTGEGVHNVFADVFMYSTTWVELAVLTRDGTRTNIPLYDADGRRRKYVRDEKSHSFWVVQGLLEYCNKSVAEERMSPFSLSQQQSMLVAEMSRVLARDYFAGSAHKLNDSEVQVTYVCERRARVDLGETQSARTRKEVLLAKL